MHVLKFGGTSVSSSKNITLVKEILEIKDGSFIVVVSAFGGITSSLLECSTKAAAGDETYLKVLKEIEERHIKTVKALLPARSQVKPLASVKIILNELEDILRGVFLIQELTDKTSDKIVGFGELLSASIITNYLQDSGFTVDLADPRKFIITDSDYGRANVDFEVSRDEIKNYFKGQKSWVCPGFIASNDQGEFTTLGRGGSDYTAAIIAASLQTPNLEIWTDVSGMMTADPRLVSSAYPIKEISYEEAMELSHFGAKVIYPPTIQPVLDANIPLHIKNTFSKDDSGTIISKSGNGNGQIIKGLSSVQNIALFNLSGSGMVGIPNFSHRLFRALSYAKVNIILITQASSEHSISVGIDQNESDKAKLAVEKEFEYEMASHRVDTLVIEKELSIIALVGSNMKQQIGVSGKMFSVLGQNGVNIKAIAQGSSEKNISVVIEGHEVKKALNAMHESFFLSDKKRINIFMVGVGNVGGTLINQISSQKAYLAKHHHIDVRIVALANSKKMYFREEGASLKNWKESLTEQGEKMSLERFKTKMNDLNLRNSIFIDNTANSEVASSYLDILKESISIVTPNKIACTQSIDEYRALKAAALTYRSKFLFETNVGAGLPVINTLSDLIKSGDEVIKIEAVLSGSLNFIFNNFNKDTRFVDVVKRAKEEGYTEPDPREDLSGSDVMRKTLILVRESGINMEFSDIVSEPFISDRCMSASSIDAFFEILAEEEASFQKMFEVASTKNQKIKYVATFDRGKASTGLKYYDQHHPFYNLEGKDNIVLFTTKRYPEQPLVIKGAGAGAEVTAMGIFADIMRIANG